MNGHVGDGAGEEDVRFVLIIHPGRVNVEDTRVAPRQLLEKRSVSAARDAPARRAVARALAHRVHEARDEDGALIKAEQRFEWCVCSSRPPSP